MDRLESTTLARATVGQMAAAEVRAAAVSTAVQQPSLTVTTAFRTVEVPIGPGGDPALAVEIAKLIVLTDLMRETPEERETRLRESERQQALRQREQQSVREELQRRLGETLEALREETVAAGRVHERVCEILGALDDGAWRLVAGHITRVADAQQVRNVVQAWQCESLEEALARSHGEALWQLAEATLNSFGEAPVETVIRA